MSKTHAAPPVESPDAPAAPPLKARTFAFLVALILIVALLALQFLMLGRFAHWMGTPFSMPEWLDPLNRFFRYGISGGLDLIIEIIWLLIIIGSTVAIYYLHALPSALWPSSPPGTETPGDAFFRAFVSCAPLGVLLWMALAILPVQSHNLPSAPTDLTALHDFTWDDALFELTQAIAAMLIIIVLFVGIFIGSAFCQRFLSRFNDGCGWQLIVAILFGIVLMTIVGLAAGPLLQDFHDKHGSTPSFWITYGVTVLLLVPVGTMWFGSRK